MAPNGESSPSDFKQSGKPPELLKDKEFSQLHKIINAIANIVPEARGHLGAKFKQLEAEIAKHLPTPDSALGSLQAQVTDLTEKLEESQKQLREYELNDIPGLKEELATSQANETALKAQIDDLLSKAANAPHDTPPQEGAIPVEAPAASTAAAPTSEAPQGAASGEIKN